MIYQPLSLVHDLRLAIGKVEPSTSIKSYEPFMVVHPSSYIRVLLLELYQFLGPPTPGTVRDQVLVHVVVDAGMYQQLKSSPEYQGSNLIHLYSSLGEMVGPPYPGTGYSGS